MEIRHPRFQNLTEDDLLELIGRDLSEKRRRMLPIPRSKLIKLARAWIDSKTSELREAVCNSVAVRDLVNNSDSAQLATAIVDLIAGMCTGVSPMTVAYLLIKRQIKVLCSPLWAEANPDAGST